MDGYKSKHYYSAAISEHFFQTACISHECLPAGGPLLPLLQDLNLTGERNRASPTGQLTGVGEEPLKSRESPLAGNTMPLLQAAPWLSSQLLVGQITDLGELVLSSDLYI